jgi:hypothetical protein
MKRLKIIFVVAFIMFTVVAKAQIYSPQLQGYNGFGTVFYPNGYYQGNLSNGFAHGVGTFYFRDGTIFQGNFFNGWRNGPGVIANPVHGFISGCWSNGQFIGNCVQVVNPYVTSQSVRKVVNDAVENFSDDADFVAYSPEGYEIERIDPNSELGGKLLGNYKGK